MCLHSTFCSKIIREMQSMYYFIHSNAKNKTYLFFDTVHLLKTVRNNLLNVRKFVFSAINFNVCNKTIGSTAGYIAWSDLHSIHDKDKQLDANLRKAPKLSYQALHPGNNKQNVSPAIGVFHETTIAAWQNYFPQRNDMSCFLDLTCTCWTCTNSCYRYTPSPLANAIAPDDDKLNFFWRICWFVGILVSWEQELLFQQSNIQCFGFNSSLSIFDDKRSVWRRISICKMSTASERSCWEKILSISRNEWR